MILIQVMIQKTQGTPNVFINNKASHRLGDSDSDNDVMVNGSSTVFINNKKRSELMILIRVML